MVGLGSFVDENSWFGNVKLPPLTQSEDARSTVNVESCCYLKVTSRTKRDASLSGCHRNNRFFYNWISPFENEHFSKLFNSKIGPKLYGSIARRCGSLLGKHSTRGIIRWNKRRTRGTGSRLFDTHSWSWLHFGHDHMHNRPTAASVRQWKKQYFLACFEDEQRVARRHWATNVVAHFWIESAITGYGNGTLKNQEI